MFLDAFALIIAPISLALNFLIYIKLAIGIIGFAYIVFVLLRVEKNILKISSNINWKQFWKQTFVKLILISIITTAFVWVTEKEALFNVVLNKSKFWITILFIYSFFSVYPQELIYRTFFFQRYKMLFTNEKLFIFVNAIVFSMAHLFFNSTLVLVLTFLGGILFALTFNKTKSTLLVSIEHAIYGCWLFTVGMGSMLGFPS